MSGRPEAMKIQQAIKRCAVDDEEIRLSDVVRSSRGNEDPSSDQALCCGRRRSSGCQTLSGRPEAMRVRQAIKHCAVDDEEIRLSGRPEAMMVRQAIKRCAVDDEEIRLSDVVRSSRGNEGCQAIKCCAVDDGGDQVVRSSRGNEDPSSDQALCSGRRGDQVVRRCQVVQRQ